MAQQPMKNEWDVYDEKKEEDMMLVIRIGVRNRENTSEFDDTFVPRVQTLWKLIGQIQTTQTDEYVSLDDIVKRYYSHITDEKEVKKLKNYFQNGLNYGTLRYHFKEQTEPVLKDKWCLYFLDPFPEIGQRREIEPFNRRQWSNPLKNKK